MQKMSTHYLIGGGQKAQSTQQWAQERLNQGGKRLTLKLHLCGVFFFFPATALIASGCRSVEGYSKSGRQDKLPPFWPGVRFLE